MVSDDEIEEETDGDRGRAVRGFLRQADLVGEFPKWYMLLVFPLDGTLLCSDNSLWAVQQFNVKKNL